MTWLTTGGATLHDVDTSRTSAAGTWRAACGRIATAPAPGTPGRLTWYAPRKPDAVPRCRRCANGNEPVGPVVGPIAHQLKTRGQK